MATPHIDAEPGDFAELVLMPGDPLRAQWLARNFLDEARQVNAVRNMLGYTGRFEGRQVSIMGSGMGMPSIAIYAHELYAEFGVQRIVRVGTCGALHDDMALGDIVLATAACTDSAMNRQLFHGWDLSIAADPAMLREVMDQARDDGLNVRAGEVFSTDFFYHPDPEFIARCQAMGVLALDMETAALYALARRHGRRALTLLWVSDLLPAGKHASTEAREHAFGKVIGSVLRALLSERPGD